MRRNDCVLAVLIGVVLSCSNTSTEEPAIERAQQAPDDRSDGNPSHNGGGNTRPSGPKGPGPWPTDALKNYSAAYNLGRGLFRVGVDDAHNIWVLRGREIGVLRPGTTAPVWTPLPGQAVKFNFPAWTICGGTSGRAYVGYLGSEPTGVHSTPGIFNPDGSYTGDPARLEGDLDVLRLQADGTVTLEAHVMLANSNSVLFDEVKSIIACAKVMEGPMKGELYFGSNHAVTRIREPKGAWPTGPRMEYEQREHFADHRHPVWFDHYRIEGCTSPDPAACEKRTFVYGYHYGVSVTPSGKIFLANSWKIGLLTPKLDPNGVAPKFDANNNRLPEGGTFEWAEVTPFELDLSRDVLDKSPVERESEGPSDEWRAAAQTYNGQYFVGSKTIGLWHVRPQSTSSAVWTRLPGSNNITALVGTSDNALWVGTGDQGLWKLDATASDFGGSLKRVEAIPGNVVQLVYDPSVSPSALYVLTDAGLYVVRGP